jgi:hypothetical protein
MPFRFAFTPTRTVSERKASLAPSPHGDSRLEIPGEDATGHQTIERKDRALRLRGALVPGSSSLSERATIQGESDPASRVHSNFVSRVSDSSTR